MTASVKVLVICAVVLCNTHTSLSDADVPCAARFGNSGYVCVCNATYCDTLNYPAASATNFIHIFTSNHTPGFNSVQSPVQPASDSPSPSDSSMVFTILVNSSVKYQELKGLGGSFTDSFGLNLIGLSGETGNNILRSYFSDNGIEYKLGRVPVASTDFSTSSYTYDDYSDDVSLANFSLTKYDYLIKMPLIFAAQEMSKHNLTLVASAWTSPNWTKVNENYLPGYLLPQYYRFWAQYLIRFLDEYKRQGIDFWAMTAGNEPINPFMIGKDFNINSVLWMPQNHKEFVKNHLGPLLRASAHTATKLLTLDDTRWYLLWWADRVMQDPDVAQYIDGFSLHWYRDQEITPDVLDQVVNKYNKPIIYSEASIVPRIDPGLKVDLGSWRRAELYIQDIIETFNHWSVGFIDWNMALDMDGGPTFPPGGGTDSAIIVNTPADEFYKNPIFYGIGHFSKFITKGSYRVKSTLALKRTATLNHLATSNPDGSTTLFIYNSGNSEMAVEVQDVTKQTAMTFNVTARSINTIVWW